MEVKKRDRYCDLKSRVDSYFDLCDAVNEEKNKLVKPYTLSGLFCHLGVTRDEFSRLRGIKRHEAVLSNAMSRIEAFIEENALNGALSCNASLNSLKYNFGWGEKQEKEEEPGRDVTVTLSPEIVPLAG